MVNFSSLSMASQHKQSHKAVGGTPSMDIKLLSSPQTDLLRTVFDHTRNAPTNHELTAHVAKTVLCFTFVISVLRNVPTTR